MIHILFGHMEYQEEKPDKHGVTSRWHLPDNATDGGPDRHGSGINKVIEQSKKQQEAGRRYAKK